MVFPKSFTSFMLMAFFPPFSFPFFLFFFLNKHFLQTQKQQVTTRRTATMAMAIKAHGGTRREGGVRKGTSTVEPVNQTQRRQPRLWLGFPSTCFAPVVLFCTVLTAPWHGLAWPLLPLYILHATFPIGSKLISH